MKIFVEKVNRWEGRGGEGRGKGGGGNQKERRGRIRNSFKRIKTVRRKKEKHTNLTCGDFY